MGCLNCPFDFHDVVFLFHHRLELIWTGGLAVLGIVAITVYKMCRKMPDEEVGCSLVKFSLNENNFDSNRKFIL